MLKIKDDKWEDFCEKAESLGFEKFNNIGIFGNNFCFIYPKGVFSVGDTFANGSDCLAINASSIGIENEHEIIITFANMIGERITTVARKKQYDILFDLIQMGYVEKVWKTINK